MPGNLNQVILDRLRNDDPTGFSRGEVAAVIAVAAAEHLGWSDAWLRHIRLLTPALACPKVKIDSMVPGLSIPSTPEPVHLMLKQQAPGDASTSPGEVDVLIQAALSGETPEGPLGKALAAVRPLVQPVDG